MLLVQVQNQEEPKIHEKTFAERKKFGDRGEDFFGLYLATKYDKGQITHRQKEKDVDFKLPDFEVITPKNTFEFEVKTTSKVKVRDFSHQLDHALKNKIVLYYIYVKILDSHRARFRPIEIRNLIDYRLLYGQGVYQDSKPKGYFTVDWDLFLGQDYEKKWIEFVSPVPVF